MLQQSIPHHFGFVPTMQPTLVAEPPEGEQWIHEIKYDGYRTELLLDGRHSLAFTRNGHDWSDRYRLILDAAITLPGSPALMDGEIIVQGEAGKSDFHGLRAAIRWAPERLVFYASLLDRRARLRDMIGEHDPAFPIQFSDHIVGNGPALFHQAEEMELEGIVSKLANSTYRSGYSTAWLKTKAFTEEHLVIVGTEQGPGPTTALCARETTHGLEYAGGAMLTLTAKERDRFWAAAERLQRSTPPLKTEKRKAANWLEPVMQARVRHLRGEEKLRHATVLELL
jgi:bifunctional non-homologous end joining protein LigD